MRSCATQGPPRPKQRAGGEDPLRMGRRIIHNNPFRRPRRGKGHLTGGSLGGGPSAGSFQVAGPPAPEEPQISGFGWGKFSQVREGEDRPSSPPAADSSMGEQPEGVESGSQKPVGGDHALEQEAEEEGVVDVPEEGGMN